MIAEDEHTDNDLKNCPEFRRALARDIKRLDAYLREAFLRDFKAPPKGAFHVN